MNRRAAKAAWAAVPWLFLTALNLAICRRLFTVEYTVQFGSIEGSFIAIARYIARHWNGFSWFPLWHCGMPFQDTYVPLLHLTVAAAATLADVSAARAYHAVIAVVYALGPVAVYFLAIRLGARRGAAFLAALFFSLLSPAALLLPEIAHDAGGPWAPRRFQVLTVYGEGPHLTALLFAPLAILALESALARRTGRALAPAALLIALTLLSNVPGTGGLGLAVFCWICAQPRGRRLAAWLIALAAAAFAYGLACYGVPPSAVSTVAGNFASMHPGFARDAHYGQLLMLAVLIATAAAGFLLARTRLPLVVRFALLYFALLSAVVLTGRSGGLELLPQPGRLQLEWELAACLLLGPAAWTLYCWIPGWFRPVAWVSALALVSIQSSYYRSAADRFTEPADLPRQSEYTTARWLDRHMHGQRIYVAGSTAFWLNAFSETPQMVGCCVQGQSMPLLAYVGSVLNYAVGPFDTTNDKTWLRALGVSALVVNGPASTDAYKDIRRPERFANLLRPLHSENGDTIYAVFDGPVSLAHVLRPGEAVPITPLLRMNGLDVVRYASIVGDPARPPASFEWLAGGTARIHARLHSDDLVSVQVPWFPGWKAFADGHPLPVSRDGLGFMLIVPRREGPCDITLRWTGRPDQPFAAAVSIATLACLSFLLYTSKPLPGVRFERAIMKRVIATKREIKPRYQFKAGPYSSHTLLLNHFPEQGQGRRVLDIGCAVGYLSEILADRGFSVASIDWPGTPHPATVEFSGGDLDDGLGPVAGLFDYIICADVLEHLRDPLRLLKECHQRLAPGGVLLGSLPNSAHWYFRWNVLLGRFPQHERGLFDSTHLHFYNWEGWVTLFERAGFRIETVESSAVPVGLALPRWDGTTLVRGLERVSFYCARIWKSLFAYQFVVCARVRDAA